MGFSQEVAVSCNRVLDYLFRSARTRVVPSTQTLVPPDASRDGRLTARERRVALLPPCCGKLPRAFQFFRAATPYGVAYFGTVSFGPFVFADTDRSGVLATAATARMCNKGRMCSTAEGAPRRSRPVEPAADGWGLLSTATDAGAHRQPPRRAIRCCDLHCHLWRVREDLQGAVRVQRPHVWIQRQSHVD